MHDISRILGVWTLALAGILSATAVGAQQAAQPAQEPAIPPLEDIGQPPRPIAIYVADRPTVMVTFSGDYGPVRMTGTLEQTPQAPLRLTDPFGKPREAAWTDVRSLAVVRTASEGQPLGSFTAYLTSDATAPAGSGTPGASSGYLSSALSAGGVGQGGWRLLRLPEGQLSINSEVSGRLTVPTDRLLEVYQQPISASVTELPRGTIRLEVMRGTTVGVPLQQVQALRRDLAAGTMSVTLADGQLITGRVAELPRVSIQFTDPSQQAPVPLERVVALEVRLPSTRTMGPGLGF